jgi:phosphatidylinositol 4-kinase A
MASHLRLFLTSPLPIFEFEFASEPRAPPLLVATAKCLALCIKVNMNLLLGPVHSPRNLRTQLTPGDDSIMSNMYSLLNYITATSKDLYESSNASQIMHNPLSSSVQLDQVTLHSVATGLGGLTEDEKRLVGISTLSVVTRLALEFKSEEVGLNNVPTSAQILNTSFSGYKIDYLNVAATLENR